MKKAVFRAKYREAEELKENLKNKEEVKEEYVEFKPVHWEGLKPPKADSPGNEKKTKKAGKKKND